MKDILISMIGLSILILQGCEPKEPELPLNSLVNISEELAGDNCEYGGVKIEIGVDENRNNSLDSDEVESSSFVCSGATSKSLINSSIEEAGANCSYGGEKIEVGVDLNNNDILDTEEVQSTFYICNGQDGLNNGLTYFVLGGDITDAEAAERIVNEVGRNTQYVLIQGTTQLTTLDLSSIEETIQIEMRSNEKLSTVNLENLTTIRGYLAIDNCPELTSIDLMKLTELTNENGGEGNGLNIRFTALVDIELTSIQDFMSISLSNNKFTSETVNRMLSHLVSINPSISGKPINLSNQTPTAPPTGQGMTDKAILEANGNTVTTD